MIVTEKTDQPLHVSPEIPIGLRTLVTGLKVFYKASLEL